MVGVKQRLKEIIIEKLESDLSDAIYHPYKSELWIIDPENKVWYLQYEKSGSLYYNQKYFSQFFYLFGMEYDEYQPLLSAWFEAITGLRIRSISRKNTNHEYIIDGVIRRSNNNNDWSLSNRHGVNFNAVKKYVDIKKKLNSTQIRFYNFILFSKIV
jgi:hypothetical protein